MDMAPYKIIKQGYMQKEPPPSKRGLRKVAISADLCGMEISDCSRFLVC